MKRLCYLLALAALLVAASAGVTSAQEVIYISEPTLTDTPKILPRSDAALWNMDFRCNPALLRLDCPYMFISDAYYIGGYHAKDTSDYSPDSGTSGSFWRGSLDSEYLLNVAGGDAGFAMKLSDRANLAFILNYRYGSVLGDGDFANSLSSGVGGFIGLINGSLEQRLDSHTVAPSVLFSYKFNDALTIGASLKYAYINERFQDDITASGSYGTTLPGNPEVVDIERDLCLSYHYLSPKLGVSLTPSDRFVLNASVAAGFYSGSVNKDADLADSFFGAVYIPTYSEDLHSSDVSGWDIAAKVRPEFKVSDALSIPVIVDFWYKDFRWGVDGAPSGYFAPYVYHGIFQGVGTIDYDNETTTWDISAGAGVKYEAEWATLTGTLAYTRWDFENRYGQENNVTGAVSGIGLTLFSQDDNETRDIVSLALMVEKEFSPSFSADFGLRYDLGWAHREYDLYYNSPYELAGPLVITTSGRDLYQNLTLSNHLSFTPTDRLSITLGGFITMPLDTLDYSLEGSSAGIPGGAYRDWIYAGPMTRGYENTGWEWGGLFSLTYEFGCPVVVPPVAPPVIEPKIEPMSMK